MSLTLLEDLERAARVADEAQDRTGLSVRHENLAARLRAHAARLREFFDAKTSRDAHVGRELEQFINGT